MRQAKLISIVMLSSAIVLMLSFLPSTNTLVNVSNAQAQTCSDVVKQALDAAVKVCNELGRNKICYANNSLSAQPKDGVSGFTFNAPGDVVAVKDLDTLKVAPYNEAEGTWGVAMLRVQANLPGTNVGQAVTMLVFGDTEVTDASTDGTLQSFYLRTGVGQPGCSEMPHNGVLLDSPTGEKVNMTVNGVDLKIGSTVFLFADAPEGESNPKLWVHTIQGSVDMTSDGVTVTIPAGKQTCAPLKDENTNDPNLDQNGPPCAPTDLDTGLTPPDLVTTLNELSQQPTSEATSAVTSDATAAVTPAPTSEPTQQATERSAKISTSAPTATSVPSTQQPQPTVAQNPSATSAKNGNNPPPVNPSPTPTATATTAGPNCQINTFTANPNPAFIEQTVQLAWESSGSISFAQLIDPNGTPNEAASSGTFDYLFGSYQDGLPEGWTLQVFCTDDSSQSAGVTVNPAGQGTEQAEGGANTNTNTKNRTSNRPSN